MKTWILVTLCALLIIPLVAYAAPTVEAKRPISTDQLSTFSPQISEEALKEDIIAELKEARKLATDKVIRDEIDRVIKKVKELIKLQKEGDEKKALELKYDIASELKGIMIAIPAPPPPAGAAPSEQQVTSEEFVALFGIIEKVLEKVEKLIDLETTPPPPPTPPPTPAVTYSAKFLWGNAVSEKEGVKPANYATTINIHNPSTGPVTLYKKAVVAHREWETPGKPPVFYKVVLDPDDAIKIDGIDICRLLGIAFPPLTFTDGFVVIQSSASLDVVAAYTASSKTGLTMDVEYIQPSSVKAEVTPPSEVHTPSGITLSPSTDTNPVGTTHLVTAFVHCKDQTPIAGVLVDFTVTGANPGFSLGCPTDSNGKVSFSYQGANPGMDTITAKEGIGGLTATATKYWEKKEVHTPSGITLSPPTATNPVGTTHTVTAFVHCQDQTPIVGVKVYFSMTADSTHYPVSGEAFTDGDGKASFTYTGTKEGKDQIVATVDSLGASAFKYWERKAVHTPSGITITPTQATNPVGTTHTVTAFVHCQNETPIAGVQVTFSVSGANSAKGTATTDSNGKASFSYQGANPGTDTITATEGVTGLTAKATKTWERKEVHTPSGIMLTPSQASNPVGTIHLVTAFVHCKDQTPIAGVLVDFTVTGANPGFSLGCPTDSNGKVSFSYNGANPGTDTITAKETVTGLIATATKTWTRAVSTPGRISLSPEKAENRIGTYHKITATVLDTNGKPLSGVTVTFTVSGANPTTGKAVTDSAGNAVFSYQGAKEGTDTITATVDTLKATAVKYWVGQAAR